MPLQGLKWEKKSGVSRLKTDPISMENTSAEWKTEVEKAKFRDFWILWM